LSFANRPKMFRPGTHSQAQDRNVATRHCMIALGIDEEDSADLDRASLAFSVRQPPLGFRPMGPSVGLNPAELSLNQPVYYDRPGTYIPLICRENYPDRGHCGSGSHPGGREFESR
jgi:hypothetical protein